MTNRRTFLKQTATLGALGSGWLTAEEGGQGAEPQEKTPAAAPGAVPGRKSAVNTNLTNVSAWEKLAAGPFSETAVNAYSLTQERDGLAIAAETRQPQGPGVIAYGVIATRERHGAPGVKGTLIFEVDFVEYTNNGEYLNKYMSAIGQPSDHEDPIYGLYLMGWGITIGNIKGFVTGIDDGDRKRAVQFHFDHYSKKGCFSTLCRQISTQDRQKYPRFTQTELMKVQADYLAGKETLEDLVRRVFPYRSMDDATALSARHYPLAKGGGGNLGGIRGDRSWGHRFGIMLSNDGNTFSWLLDGKVMDSADISGYFSSSTDVFAEGVFISIGGGAGFRKNRWRFANPQIR